MRAAVAAAPGPAASVVRIRDVAARPEPGPGEVDVRMRATTVNPSDLITVSGAYRSRTVFPFVPGFEGVGEIAAAGPGVPPDAVGRRVLPIGSAGNWQETKRTEYAWCVPVPDDIGDRDACFAYINPATALTMVERFVPQGARVAVVTAATSVIAGQIAELLNGRGIRPVGLVRGTPGRRVADAAAWSAVIPTNTRGWRGDLADAVGASRADVVFDSVGGPQGPGLMEVLRPGGTLVHYGLLSGRALPSECFTGYRDRHVEMFRLRDLVHSLAPGDRAGLLAPVFDHLRAGRLRTEVTGVHAFADLPALLGDGGGPGKPLVVF